MSAFTDESWYEREIVTDELRWLGDELCRRTGRPADAAGDKGNEAHDSGSHRSQEWLLNSRFCDNRSYTVQSGLTATQARHIAGFDFTPGSAAQMVAQCQRLYAALKAGQLEEVREFYGNVDGDQVVDGWNNLENRNASSDSSHLWHWHLSFDRRRMTDRALMERVVAIVMGEGDAMFCKKGDKGEAVRLLQLRLNEVTAGRTDLKPLVVDSSYGDTTAARVYAVLSGPNDGANFNGTLADRLDRKLFQVRLVAAVADGTIPVGRDGVDGEDGEDGTDGRDGKDAVLAPGTVLVVQTLPAE